MSLTSQAGNIMPLSIYAVLKGEHREVSMLLKALSAAPENWEEIRDTILPKLRRELLSHAKAEQKTVYERLRGMTDKAGLIDHAEEDHTSIEKHLHALEQAAQDEANWKNALEMLQAEIEHHVTEEESIFFDEMKRVFSDEDSKAATDAFTDEKKRILEQMP